MRTTITISLPAELREELDRVSAIDGVSRSDVIRESLRDYLFIRRFRALRGSMLRDASRQGIYTDQDVFDRVS
jgi:metal-responsive CopG/Arc/MetJ family transcriptional regulator